MVLVVLKGQLLELSKYLGKTILAWLRNTGKDFMVREREYMYAIISIPPFTICLLYSLWKYDLYMEPADFHDSFISFTSWGTR